MLCSGCSVVVLYLALHLTTLLLMIGTTKGSQLGSEMRLAGGQLLATPTAARRLVDDQAH